MRKTIEQRFWEKVDRRGDDECWEWTGATGGPHSDGYGMFYPSHSAKVLAHRQAYTLTSGDIPSNMVVCHTCDNELCCNPHHLFVGTQQDNMLDMRRKGRGKNESWKLTRETAYVIVAMRYDEGVSVYELADTFHLSVGYVSRLCRGQCRPYVYEEFMALRQPIAA